MRKQVRNGFEHALGLFGLLLLLLVARLAKPAYLTQGTRPQPVRRFLARNAMDGIVAIGRLVDRLSGYASPGAGDAPIVVNRPVLTR